MIHFPSYTLEIQQTLAQVGVRSSNAEVHMEMSPSLAERQNPPEWNVKPFRAELSIDNSAFYAEFDMEGPVAWSAKLAGEAAAQGEEGVRWVARNGDLCYRATPGDKRPLLDYAMRYFNEEDARVEYNVDISPHSRPQVTADVDPAVQFEVEPFTTAAMTYSFSYVKPSIEIYLAVQPELQIRAVPQFDHRV